MVLGFAIFLPSLYFRKYPLYSRTHLHSDWSSFMWQITSTRMRVHLAHPSTRPFSTLQARLNLMLIEFIQFFICLFILLNPAGLSQSIDFFEFIQFSKCLFILINPAGWSQSWDASCSLPVSPTCDISHNFSHENNIWRKFLPISKKVLLISQS